MNEVTKALIQFQCYFPTQLDKNKGKHNPEGVGSELQII